MNRGPRASERVRVGLLLALGAIAFHGLVTWDPRTHGFPAVVGWFFETSDSSPQVVFGIVALLLLFRQRAIRAALGSGRAPGLAVLCFVPAVAIHLWAQWVDAPDLSVVSLGLVALGAGFQLGGRPLARVLAPPLAILLLAIPIPGALHNFLVYPYQLTTADTAHALLRAAGFDVALQGDLIRLAGQDFEVIETCSGLRSALTLLLLASAWAVFFRCSPAHTACLLLATPVIAFGTNSIRVLVLILAANPEVQESHVMQGFLMIIVGAFALGLVDRLLLRIGFSPADPALAPVLAADGPRVAARRWRLLPLGLALLALAAATLGVPPLRPPPPGLPPPPDLPRRLAGWRIQEAPDSGAFLGNVRFTHRSHLEYLRGRERVTVFLGWDDRRLRLRSLLSEKNAVPGVGFEVDERGPVTLEPGAQAFDRVLAHRFAWRSLAIHAYRGTGSVLEETLRALLALDQPASPFARSARPRLLRISTDVDPRAGGLEAAEARLQGIFEQLAPALVK